MIYWNSFSDFLAMGGYGSYVWGSFGVRRPDHDRGTDHGRRRRKATLARLRRQIRAEERADTASASRNTAQ